MAEGVKMTWQPMPKNPQRLAYMEPVVVVGKHNKAYFSMVAEEKMGSPDEIVFLVGPDDQRAVRPARSTDASTLRRKLDPAHTVTVPQSVLRSGTYRLRLDGDGQYRLLPIYNTERQLTTKTRGAR